MKNIVFERDSSSDSLYELNGTGFLCYHGTKPVGRFCVFRNHSFARVQEIYIEVFPVYQGKGYGRDIYSNFIKKGTQLGFKNRNFYAAVYNENVSSLKLCESMGFEKVPFHDTKATAFKFRAS